MAVYYKFKSEKNCNCRSIFMDDHFISVLSVKQRIFESRYVTMGFDLDIEISNAQTKEVYLDEATLIPKNTSVLIRRIPRYSRMRFVPRHYESKAESNIQDNLPINLTEEEISTVKDVEPLELDDGFGDDIYVSHPAVEAKNAVTVDPASVKNKDDLKIKTLSWESRADEGFGPGRGFGRMMGQKPPQGYVCHRCNKPGHLIQHCPTNGDPDYDIMKFKPPTGIPKTMLIANPEGSYVLPDGGAATVKPDESTFEKEIERIPTSCHSVGDVPPELCCLLCKQVMKDAVLTSKCCFNSFCDKCMRDYIISKSVCVCGAKDILADDLIPNKTLRDAIIRILESSSSSSNNNALSSSQRKRKSASPTQSVASKGVDAPSPPTESPVKKKKARLGVAETSPYFAADRLIMPNYVSPYPSWTPMVMNTSFPLCHTMPPQRDFSPSNNSDQQERVCNNKQKLSSESKPSDVNHHCKRKRSSDHPSPIIRELAVL